ncbi:hypothetical protein HYH03_003392 [Edaphochlamys debaryana]|uniref:RBR-type E3 ubiquitin transferase n=1 Tax=Edaphochlamys debaryana TaxID=47281 RepID=A0A835Y9T6_9CHLO|nr:hypothetical protein HYH03_003392 [Edaphochlamys debaryana]|eukprot:KAG2498646.1 hypothetical protein HYH03_003392 [Edaphochlamys debaryana]
MLAFAATAPSANEGAGACAAAAGGPCGFASSRAAPPASAQGLGPQAASRRLLASTRMRDGPHREHQCLGCLGSFLAHHMRWAEDPCSLAAPAPGPSPGPASADASSSFLPTTTGGGRGGRSCAHAYCRGCLSRCVCVALAGAGAEGEGEGGSAVPVMCPGRHGLGACPARVPRECVEEALCERPLLLRRFRRLQARLLPCMACADPFARGDLLSAFHPDPGAHGRAGGGGGGSGGGGGGGGGGCCEHVFCAGCLGAYAQGCVRERRYPLPCPMAGGGCRAVLPYGLVEGLLAGRPDLMQAHGALAAEAVVPPARLAYCPHAACSSPLELPEGGLAPDAPVRCPACRGQLCACMQPGWHKGYTCAQFQALPPEQRSLDAAATLALARQRGWQRCSGCRLLVERTEGCSFMACSRCRAQFCYLCGVQTQGHHHPGPCVPRLSSG